MKHIRHPDPDQQTSLCRRLAAFIMLLLLAASFPSGAASPAEREFAQAVQSFRSGRTAAAYGQFMALANRGDVDSARIALFMSNYGPLLYGRHWDVLPRDAEYWTLLVHNSGTSGRPAPEFQPLVYVRPPANRR